MKVTDRTIRADAVELVTQAFGDPNDRPLLLIMGVMASMLWWPEKFCEQLAAAGHYVIRFDNRDTGLSTPCTPGEPNYSFDDMADDAIRILDGYGIDKAHVAGMSMGGMLAQRAALKHSRRMLSLTLLSTSPSGVDTSGLPGMTEEYRAHSAKGETVDWSNREQFIAYVVSDCRALAAPDLPFDESAARAFVTRDVDRARNFASATNHFILAGGGEELSVRDLVAPLLVVHGTADPIFPIEHGLAFADAVKGATVVPIEGGGHELNPVHWDRIVNAVAAHTASVT